LCLSIFLSLVALLFRQVQVVLNANIILNTFSRYLLSWCCLPTNHYCYYSRNYIERCTADHNKFKLALRVN
jgi:hypothetical protein